MAETQVHSFLGRQGFFSFEHISRYGSSDRPGTTFDIMNLDSHHDWLVVKTANCWIEASVTDVLSKVQMILVFQHLADC